MGQYSEDELRKARVTLTDAISQPGVKCIVVNYEDDNSSIIEAIISDAYAEMSGAYLHAADLVIVGPSVRVVRPLPEKTDGDVVMERLRSWGYV